MALPDTSLERFLYFLLQTKAEQTARKYHQAATKFLAFLAKSGIPLEKVPGNILHAFGQHLIHNENLKASSANVFTHGARAYLNWLRDHDGRESLPVPGQATIRQDGRPIPVVLTPTQIKAFLTLASRQREPFRTALLLLPYTGLRANEAVTLSLTDIKTATVRDEKHIVLRLDPRKTKGNKARDVPILSDGRKFILDYLRDWRSGRRGSWLFPSPYGGGKPISDRSLRLYVEKIAERIKAPSLSPHAFRRIYTTTLHRQGVDIITISRILGHGSIQTTRDHYLAVETDDLVGAVADVRLVPRGEHAERVADAKTKARDLLGKTRDERLDIPDIPPNLLDLLSDGEDDDAA
ncbi:MAG: tyrosine-type recombinase/integrase [Acidobacteria bacterium]|nr:tyrosine-type recombinase/integrase [Acidobacteriota bacterium]